MSKLVVKSIYLCESLESSNLFHKITESTKSYQKVHIYMRKYHFKTECVNVVPISLKLSEKYH